MVVDEGTGLEPILRLPLPRNQRPVLGWLHELRHPAAQRSATSATPVVLEGAVLEDSGFLDVSGEALDDVIAVPQRWSPAQAHAYWLVGWLVGARESTSQLMGQGLGLARL